MQEKVPAYLSQNTIHEIFSQPDVWLECLQFLRTFDIEKLVGGLEIETKQWLFIGCGTSYYLAQAAAASFSLLAQCDARAVPASEVLLHPELSMPEGRAILPLLISRSGHTSEIVAVAESLRNRDLPFLAVTCDGNELAAATTRVLRLPVSEKSTVMTGSFTSMLIALQFIAATLGGDESFQRALQQLPTLVRPLLSQYSPTLQLLAEHPFDDIVVLGQGPFFPIAAEVSLKVMECSSSYTQYFHTLEFRHGPKSIINTKVLVIGLISRAGEQEELAVLQEMKRLGAVTVAVVSCSSPQVTEAADVVVNLDSALPAVALQAAYVVCGQLFGAYVGMAKGLNPDEPLNLTRVVTF